MQLEKLVGESNWPSWQVLMKTVLECDEVFDVVNGTLKKPVEGDAQYDDKLKAWMTANNRAKKRILFSLDTKPLLRVAGCDTAADCWKKLHEVYDCHSEENVDLLKHRFHNIMWNVQEGVQGLLSDFDDVQTKMMMLNCPIPEEDLCSRFLQVLPSEFDHVYVSWHDLAKADKTWSKLQQRCLNFELRLNNRSEDSTQMVMLFKKKRSKLFKISSDGK